MTTATPLWRHPDFRRLWAAQAISDFGARITREGLPIMAVTALAATPAELGLLSAMSSGAGLVVGLSAGGFVDTTRRRTILVATDIVRAVVLASLPLAALTGLLTVWQVFIAAGLVAAATALFDIADHAFLPTLLTREQLTEGNARISATEALAEIGGPALAGLLFQWLTAPIAVAVNAVTYLVSALFLGGITAVEAPSQPAEDGRPFTGIRTGFAAAWAQPVVRIFLITSVVSGFFGGVFGALYIVFALKTLSLPTALLGLAIACGGLGALIGSASALPAARLLGAGPAIIVAGVITFVAVILIPLAPPDPQGGLAVLIVSQLLGDSSAVVALILAVSLRQSLVPQNLLGRVGATFQAAAGGSAVAGALLGGLLGEAIGVRGALSAAAAGFALVPLIAAASPLRHFRGLEA